jgi:decaheme cytochrome c component MtrC/MtrF-like protein
MTMKAAFSSISCCLVVLALAACGSQRENATAQQGNTFCFNCHSETTALGKKILWAQAGFEESVHAKGQVERIYTALPGTGTGCTGGTGGATQNACETGGGTWAGTRYILTGTEKTGSNAFYANSGGCQMCHTMDGYRKRISGAYDDPAAGYSIKFSWDPRAQVGSPSTTPNTPLTQDIILNPQPIGCFACHTPHSIGTADNVHLDQSIPVGTVITTQSGGVWGDNKAKGHICAECHQIRQNNNASTSAGILANVKGTGKFTVSAPYGPHHGPQADMLLGKGGAEYTGSATGPGGTVAFAGTYGNSPHTANRNADCVSCHMQDDFEDINVTGSFSVSPAVGGHSFTNKGIVHGAEKVLAVGCGSVTDTVGCHTVAGVTGSKGNIVQASNFATTNRYLQAGDAYFKKSTSPTSMVDSNYQFKVNELLSKLADPAANCGGLLDAAATAAGGKHTWTTFNDGVTIDPRCISNGTTTGINKSAAPADDNTNASVRFLKGLWNFKFLLEDKSFGVHNTTYILELLYDSCTDLTLLTGAAGACGATPGRCSACEGTFVTTRP